MTITREEFESAVVNCGFPRPNGKYEYFKCGLRENGFTDREAAMFLAQVIHESHGLQTRREYNPEGHNYGVYYGRGYIQLTWDYNYRAASRAIFGDDRLVNNPELVESEELAWKTAFWFWTDRVRSVVGAGNGDFGATTRAINGALEGDNPNPLRYQYYQKVLRAFGIN